MQGKKQSNAKSRGKLVHLGGHPAKPQGRPRMSYDLLALDKFLSGLYAYGKYMVMLGHAIMVII
jgi:hypothetical protein